jgi:hypothetical protein
VKRDRQHELSMDTGDAEAVMLEFVGDGAQPEHSIRLYLPARASAPFVVSFIEP